MVKDHRGDCFKSTFEMCQAWGIDYYLFAERRKRGWSLQQALLTPVCEGSTVFDHEGHIFASERAMCETGELITIRLNAVESVAGASEMRYPCK